MIVLTFTSEILASTGVFLVWGLVYRPTSGQIRKPFDCSQWRAWYNHGQHDSKNQPLGLFACYEATRRTISAESATKTINGAIIRKVDIMSISWTIERKTDLAVWRTELPYLAGKEEKITSEAYAIEMAEKVIDAVVEAKILMFYLTSDDMRACDWDTLPYGKAAKYILHIGAAFSLD